MFKNKLKRSASYYIDKNRIFIIFAILFLIAVFAAPNFFNAFNLNSLFKTANLYAMLAVGLSIVMICGQLDLSIQAVMNLGAVIALGLFSDNGMSWGASFILAIAIGAGFGLFNGFMVAKAKINSFIVTLGTMTIVTGVIFLYTKSGSISVNGDYSFSDWLLTDKIPLLPPITIITVAVVVAFAIILNKTRFGRAFYMVGGNAETAWLAGIKKDRQIILAFIICGALAAFAGSLFAAGQGTAVPNMGDKGISPLMVTIAAVIIGGISMAGGKGGVLKSYFAVLTLITIFNMLSCFGTGYEAQVFTSGVVLAAVVLYESISQYLQDQVKGIRLPLLREVKK
jgi:ribose/xylose/arabinose/galactoside ABC-type transport system permease subunit